eukprot:4118680-Amphidinium_carterae.1
MSLYTPLSASSCHFVVRSCTLWCFCTVFFDFEGLENQRDRKLEQFCVANFKVTCKTWALTGVLMLSTDLRMSGANSMHDILRIAELSRTHAIVVAVLHAQCVACRNSSNSRSHYNHTVTEERTSESELAQQTSLRRAVRERFLTSSTGLSN